MRKQVFGRRFKRDKNERKALFSGLVSAMVLRGSITTTEEKAKAIRGSLEKLVTKAKKGDPAKRSLSSYLKPFEIDKMVNEIAPSFKDVNGGYIRIIKTGRRFSDNASMATIEWTKDIIKQDIPVALKKKVRTQTKAVSKKSETAKKVIRKSTKERKSK